MESSVLVLSVSGADDENSSGHGREDGRAWEVGEGLKGVGVWRDLDDLEVVGFF